MVRLTGLFKKNLLFKLSTFFLDFFMVFEDNISRQIRETQERFAKIERLTSPALQAFQDSYERFERLTSPALRAFQDSYERFEKLTSPALRAFQEKHAVFETLTSPTSWVFQERLKEIERFTTPNSQVISQRLTEIQKLLRPLQLHDNRQNLVESLQQVSDFWRNSSDSFFLSYPNINITETFASRFLEMVEEAFAQENNEITEKTLNSIEVLVDEQYEKCPKNLLSREGLFNLILSILLFYFGYLISQNSETNIINRQNEIEINLESRFRIILEKDELKINKKEDEKYYVVVRKVNLRAKPTTDSPVLATLPPNQAVKLINRKSKWIYVEYFDYVEAIPKMGWVFKKYLQLQSKDK